ncbi:FHA domain-containing protein [Desulfolucanica intricata]|uniref:FHA domain-containing protein n=1 Tax=Desulfolucanica intricata TaxID=1285191 RepID=UPI0008324EBD|nr:FHA domain-containing protein [Desulfolucanica intricata]
MTLLLTVLRYLFLIVFYVFIIFLIKQLVFDVRHTKPRLKEDYKKYKCCHLKVVSETEEYFGPGKCFEIAGSISIGRDNSNDIQINNDFVSKKHARITLKEHRYLLEDLKSLNGTYINKELVNKPVILLEGDEITVGGVTFKFERCAYEVE